MRRGVMFGEVICMVILPFVPVNAQLVVCAFVTKPVPAHVPCFGSALFDIGMNEAVRGRIVCFYRGCLLWMTKSSKGNPTRNSFLGVAVDATGLCLGCRAHNAFDCLADG